MSRILFLMSHLKFRAVLDSGKYGKLFLYSFMYYLRQEGHFPNKKKMYFLPSGA